MRDILTEYAKKLKLGRDFLDEFEKVPKIKEYDIDLRYYDKFLGRA